MSISTALTVQSKIPEMVTDRPDQTESSDIVPKHFLQLETGLVVKRCERPVHYAINHLQHYPGEVWLARYF